MSETLDTQIAESAEIAVLVSEFLQSLGLDHELRCQAQRVHDPSSPFPEIVPCSTTVEYRLTSCTGSALSCRNAAERGMRHMALPGLVCADCLRPASECWKVVPI